MNILVLDVAADSSGALTVLHQFYHTCLREEGDRYFFCVGTPELAKRGNIEVIRLPWVKKSWFHRLYFDFFYVHRLIRRYQIDRIFSLQNIAVLSSRLPQDVYIHQSLPFVDVRFKLREGKRLWMYQNVISHLIYFSIRKCESVTVQTAWMRDAVLAHAGKSKPRVIVQTPQIDGRITETFRPEMFDGTFFYPATPFPYKNHAVLCKAVRLLVERGYTALRVILTLTPTQLPENCRADYEAVGQYFELRGSMPYEEIIKLYGRSALVFPSYVETFGLPLAEARRSGSFVVASDCPFSREILEGYTRAQLFNPFSPEQLADCMQRLLCHADFSGGDMDGDWRAGQTSGGKTG